MCVCVCVCLYVFGFFCFLVWKGRAEVFQSHFRRLGNVPVYRRELLGHQVCQRWAASHWWVSGVLNSFEDWYHERGDNSDQALISVIIPFSACAPTFEFNPMRKQLLGAKDGRVVIECKPRAAPRPRYTWTKGKELLFNNSRSVQLTETTTSCPLSSSLSSPIAYICSISILFDGSLEILNATTNDEGVYTCFAENDRGKANSSGYLTITGQWICAYAETGWVNWQIEFSVCDWCPSLFGFFPIFTAFQ